MPSTKRQNPPDAQPDLRMFAELGLHKQIGVSHRHIHHNHFQTQKKSCTKSQETPVEPLVFRAASEVSN